MDCQAFLLERDLTMRTGERALADARDGDVVLKVDWAGICGSDLHVMRTGGWVTDWPATLGHEIYGHVEHAPAASGLTPGAALAEQEARVRPRRTCPPLGISSARGERRCTGFRLPRP